MKRLLLSLLLAVICLSSALPARASAEYSTSFYSTYTVGNEGETAVEHRIELKNNLSHIYTTEYTISIGGSSLVNLEVEVNGKTAPYREDASAGITTLTISVPDPVIGKDQVLPILVKYQTKDLTEVHGNIREINIPRLSRANEAALYSRKIIIPEKLGSPNVETPRPTVRSTSEKGETVLEYVGFASESITLLFGSHEDYQLKLIYKISNPTLTQADTEIALPPDTEYQQILLSSLTPSPSRVKLDPDGNWLAVYPLKSQESKEIQAVLFASVYPLPTFPSLVSDLNDLTAPAEYWETKSSIVKSLAANLKSPLNIYNYAVENLVYDHERIKTGERVGAEKALAEPTSAICTEFTDSFIALARANGVPARELNGYARTSNAALRPAGFSEDILHAWPEYYDRERKTWIQVDPTWGRTTGGIDYFQKMDFGHIAFVRHGRESAYPYPAGSYKSDPQDKTLEITLADSMPEPVKTYTEGYENGKYTITNTGNVALRNYRVILSSGSEHTIEYLPPFGKEIVTGDGSDKLNLLEKIILFLKNLF